MVRKELNGPSALISCRGTRVLVNLFLAFYVFQGLLMLGMLVYIMIKGAGSVIVSPAGDEMRFSTTLLGLDIFHSVSVGMSGGSVDAITNPEAGFAVITIFGFLVKVFPLIVILWMLRGVLIRLRPECSPFTGEIAWRIRVIGIIFLLEGVLGKLIFQVGVAAIGFQRFYMENPWSLTAILTGLLVMILAKIFQYGCALQEESDETV